MIMINYVYRYGIHEHMTDRCSVNTFGIVQKLPLETTGWPQRVEAEREKGKELEQVNSEDRRTLGANRLCVYLPWKT